MCEFTQRVLQLQPAMSGRSVNDFFPGQFRFRYPYQLVREGHCLECKMNLPFKDRKPTGRATRSLCARCYRDLIEKTINYNCFICGQPLPEYNKVLAQKKDRREISHHIDDGYCLDYFTLVHCKVVGGVDMTFLQDEQPGKIYVQNANYQSASQRNKLEFRTLQSINNLKRAIHHNLVNGPFLPGREHVPNRNLLEAPKQPNSREFRSNEIDIDFDSVPVIRLPQ